MIHELGHSLGIPHLRPDQSEMMQSNGFGCVRYKENVCKIKNKDMEVFLKPYNLRKKRPRVESSGVHYLAHPCYGSAGPC